MAITISSGMRLTPARLNALGPLIARKTADQSIASSTTLANDSALLIPNLVANAVYELQLHVLYRAALAGATPAMKVDFTVPSGASIVGSSFHLGNPSSTLGVCVGNGAVGGVQALTTNSVLREFGLLVMGASAGTLNFRWCQNISSASATTVASGSYLLLTQVS
jgi:hypothetical protein